MTLLGQLAQRQLAQDALRCALSDLGCLPPLGEPLQWSRSANLVLALHAAWHHVDPDVLRQQIKQLMQADPRVHLTLRASGLHQHPLVIAAFARAVTDCKATCSVRVIS
jgi:hypothetical protein